MKFAHIVFIVVLLLTISQANAYLIESFHSDIEMFTNSSYEVEERIEVNFGNEQRHGIYRDIVYKYRLPMRTYRVLVNILDVTDDSGNEYDIKVKKQGDYVNIRIGSPNYTVSGTHVYRIRYRVENGMLFFDDHDELYWNVTGTEWPCEIKKASATVRLPVGTPEGEIKTICFSGAYGSEAHNCDSNIGDGEVDFWATNALGTYDNLSIAVSIPKGILNKPGFASWVRWYLLDLWPLLLFLFWALWLVIKWNKAGRDPVKMSVAPRYEPPEDLAPAEAGTLIDESVDIRDMTSTIVDLAVRGYIKIFEIEKKKIVLFKKSDYILVKLRNPNNSLKSYEKKVLSALFERGSIEPEDRVQLDSIAPGNENNEAITISSLKDKFYMELPIIKDAIYDGLVANKYFPSRPDHIRQKYAGFGIVLLVVGFPIAAFASNWAFIASFVPAGLMTIIFGKFMPRKTKKGAISAINVAGFEEFVRRVEKDRIERMATEDPTVFERLLPYAMALGVADQWAEAFEGIFKEAPKWFVSGSGQAFHTHLFVHSLGGAIHSTGAAMAARPRSSGAGGGHSGFGGGGFSGGGFGGGGGGAW
ncbi:DUF2207 domain-containing protein [bacterium]|nr:DUF2207 domain-containing protein [bacterium]